MTVETRMVGPLFDGRALKATEKMTHVIEEDISQEANREVHARLGQVIKHPTGYYESQVQVERASASSSRVTDGGVIYGPWLEGVGSRNQTTSFKGYHTFRDIAQKIGKEAEARANAIALKYVAEMN